MHYMYFAESDALKKMVFVLLLVFLKFIISGNSLPLLQLIKVLVSNSAAKLAPCGLFYSIWLASPVLNIWHLRCFLWHTELVTCYARSNRISTVWVELTFWALPPSFSCVSHSIWVELAPRGTLHYFSSKLVFWAQPHSPNFDLHIPSNLLQPLIMP